MRSNLIHKNGLIDKKYIDKSKFRDINDLGKKIFSLKTIPKFNSSYLLLYKFFNLNYKKF